MSRDEKIIATAVWLYRASMSGIASRDISEGRMTREQSSPWLESTVKSFEAGLRDMTKEPSA